MKCLSCIAALGLAALAAAHGDHLKQEAGESNAQYAQRHMATEHHIDTFDLESFFLLHDLDRDGFWDKEEIEAVYGVHHVYNRKHSKDDEEHQQKAANVVNAVLTVLDKDGDGKVSMAELQALGLDALPSFNGAEGHHYDVESEFFLHHEEMYHNTPETQTDESYNHPEDLEHFAHHEQIEVAEAEKEAAYQGITVEEALAQHDEQPAETVIAMPKYTRIPPPEKQDPVDKFRNAKAQGGANDDWGTGEAGYKSPKTPAEKMRKNVPYKYKFKRSWGDF